MKSAEEELIEIADRQRALLLELLVALMVGVGVIILAPAAELGGKELQTVYLCAVAGCGVGVVTFVHRLLDLLDTCCPRCNEAFYAFPFHLPLLLPRRCSHCAQSLDRPHELPRRTPA